jgi:hypothetical protein
MVGVRGLAVLTAAAACGCTSAAAPAQAPTENRAPSETPPPIPAVRLVDATVYDGAGNAMKCGAPLENCKNASADTAFFDRCRLAGFQVRRCGCESYCSGKVASQNLAYAADGASKPCAPANVTCAPPDTSAAFQDACTDAGHRLEVCGCEWLCSGPPKH